VDDGHGGDRCSSGRFGRSVLAAEPPGPNGEYEPSQELISTANFTRRKRELMFNRKRSALRAGEWVQVRTKQEILATLDAQGRLDGLPFMPEMFAFCGKRLRVDKRAHKVCDPSREIHSRRMESAVHLEGVRCDGAEHGGCQARCLIFWKEAWLCRVSDPSWFHPTPASGRRVDGQCTEGAVQAATSRTDPDCGEAVYNCQSTSLPEATERWRTFDVRQYIEDYTSGNVSLRELLSVFCFWVYSRAVSARIGLATPLRWFYNSVQNLRNGTPYPLVRGRIPNGGETPVGRLNVQPGELVKIRSQQEIHASIDQRGRNRGLVFDVEMAPYCGGTYRVLDRVTSIIDERTGRLLKLKSDCIMLEGVVCRSRYSHCRRFCSRRIYSFWREIWLERVSPREVNHEENCGGYAGTTLVQHGD